MCELFVKLPDCGMNICRCIKIEITIHFHFHLHINFAILKHLNSDLHSEFGSKLIRIHNAGRNLK